MRILLIANTIFEFLVAALVLVAPSILAGPNASVTMARVLGGNALGLGTLSALMFLLNLSDPKYLRAGLTALAVFHTAVTIAQLLNTLDGSTPFPVVIVHGLFAVSFIYFASRTLQAKA